MLEAKRTLVKSAPELWSEISDCTALARHLAPFGSVTIKRTEPDSLVVWEGERASGAVRLEPSGFGTKVTIETAIAPLAPDPEPDPEPAAGAAEAEAEAPAGPEPSRSFWGRLFRRRAPEPEPVEEPPPPPPPPVPVRPAMADDAALLVLTDMLDTLGHAHHRPFSRI
jgi:hypothetical protein